MSVCLDQYRQLLERHRALEAEHARALAVVEAARLVVDDPFMFSPLDLEDALSMFDNRGGAE